MSAGLCGGDSGHHEMILQLWRMYMLILSIVRISKWRIKAVNLGNLCLFRGGSLFTLCNIAHNQIEHEKKTSKKSAEFFLVYNALQSSFVVG